MFHFATVAPAPIVQCWAYRKYSENLLTIKFELWFYFAKVLFELC